MRAPTFGPCLYFVSRKDGGAFGAFTTEIDDICGCGESYVFVETQSLSEYRLGATQAQESPSAHAGMEVSQGSDFSVKQTKECTKKAKNLVKNLGSDISGSVYLSKELGPPTDAPTQSKDYGACSN